MARRNDLAGWATDLRRSARSITAELATADEETAQDIVDDARRRARRTRQGRFVAPTIRRQGSSVLLGVRGGPDGVRRQAASMGAEFGAKRWKRFRRYRGGRFSDSGLARRGYFLHPAIAAHRDLTRQAEVIADAVRARRGR